MLILIILGIVGLGSIALIVLGAKDVFCDSEIAIVAGVTILVCVVLAMLISGSVAGGIQAHTERDYINALNEKATLEYFIAHADDDILRNTDLCERVIKFNNSISHSRYCANSKWIGIWVNKKIGTIDYISLTITETK